MTIGGSLFKRFLAKFRQKDTPLEPEPEPIYEDLFDEFDIDDFSNEWYHARFDRTGIIDVIPYKNTNRYLTFVGRDIPRTEVAQNQFLTGTALVIGPDGKAFEVTVSFKSGEKFDPDKFDRLLAGKIKEKYPSVEEPSDYILNSKVTTIWYLNEYRPKGQ
jgi:hypothetical protein